LEQGAEQLGPRERLILQAVVHLYITTAEPVGSRAIEDADAGLARMSQAGASITTSEMTILELVGDAKRPEFRQVLPLVR